MCVLLIKQDKGDKDTTKKLPLESYEEETLEEIRLTLHFLYSATAHLQLY